MQPTKPTTTEGQNTEGSSRDEPQRWGLWLAIERDLRFLSHRDCARLIERAAARARLPVRYSQGYNPRPILALVCPRPVGVASREDLLVASLAGDVPPDELRRRMNEQTPDGMRFTRARRLPPKQDTRPRQIRYECDLAAERLAGLRERLEAFEHAADWPVERHPPATGRRRHARTRVLDLRALVAEATLRQQTLCWTCVPREGLWARPGELLEAMGLDAMTDLAATVRTAVDYGL